METFIQKIKSTYDKYKEARIKDRFFKHSDILTLIYELREKSMCEVEEIGKSVEQRTIYSIKIGTGNTVVLLWSQMHGNEPTATAAIFDILHFLTAIDNNDGFRKRILEELTLYFVPMLNPDGAERFKRENALGIDINRDALALSSPESKILKSIRNKTNADYGFNLHDQSPYYSAGDNNKPASISFLASSFNQAKDINEKRKSAMRTIVAMNRMLQTEIKDMVATYNDDFMPNAFGDNIAKWGTSVILIESGGYSIEDVEKQTIRRLNYLSILTALYSIATKQNMQIDYKEYFNIPTNRKDKFFDIILRNVKQKYNNYEYTTDIGIRQTTVYHEKEEEYINKHYIAQIGDLSFYYGYLDINANNLHFYKNDNENDEVTKAVVLSSADFALINDEGNIVYTISNGEIKKQ